MLNSKQANEIYGYCKETFRRRAIAISKMTDRYGKFASIKTGRGWRVDRNALEDYEIWWYALEGNDPHITPDMVPDFKG